jgi:hypothetical protein
MNVQRCVVALSALLLALSSAPAARAQQTSGTAGPQRAAPPIHHAVSNVPAAQAAFDRGLLDYYAYNPEAAEHEFYTAADLDRHLAMAYWGIALSNAPNLNVPATDGRDAEARTAIQRAKAYEATASAEDQAFIDAAALRFDDKTKASRATLLANYRDALKAIALAYPDDPDAAALYAEAALYVAVGDSRGSVEKMTQEQRAAYVATFAALLPYYQTSLAKFPQHVGLLHFYIHAAQMAEDSQAAVSAATQLAADTFPPEDSHLTHMPGHTFFDVGMYNEALDVGERSVAMDNAEFACCHPGHYSAERYYQSHDVAFILYALTETGHLAEAVEVARRADNPVFLARQLVASHDWKAVLGMAGLRGTDPTLPFALGLANAKLGDTADAEKALAAIPNAPADSPSRIATVGAMRLTLMAEIALASHDDAKALQLLVDASAAATKGDVLGTVEMPALYYYSPHMALAALAIQLGKADVAKAALQAELAASPREDQATKALTQLHG